MTKGTKLTLKNQQKKSEWEKTASSKDRYIAHKFNDGEYHSGARLKDGKVQDRRGRWYKPGN